MKAGVFRGLGLGLKLTVSALLVGFLLNEVGIQTALSRLRTVDPAWLAAAFGVAMFQVVICSQRWRVILNAIEAALPFWTALRFWVISAFFNQTLPSAVGGDAVRGYLAYKNGMKLAQVASSLFLDRAITVLALVMLVAVLTPFAVDGLESGAAFQRLVWWVAAGAVAGMAAVMMFDFLPRRLARFRAVRALRALARDARRAFLHPRNGATALMWSVAGHVNLALVVYVLFRALHADVALITCLVLFPPVLLAQTVPVSVAGWGVREGAMVALFSLAGVTSDAALAASILYGLVLMITSLPGAALWLMNKRHRVKTTQTFSDSAVQIQEN